MWKTPPAERSKAAQHHRIDHAPAQGCHRHLRGPGNIPQETRYDLARMALRARHYRVSGLVCAREGVLSAGCKSLSELMWKTPPAERTDAWPDAGRYAGRGEELADQAAAVSAKKRCLRSILIQRGALATLIPDSMIVRPFRTGMHSGMASGSWAARPCQTRRCAV